MKFFITFSTLCILVFFIYQCGSDANQLDSVKLETDQDSISYIIGTDMARSLITIKEDVNVNALAAGMKAQLEGNPLLVSPENSQRIMNAFREKLRKQHEEKNNASKAQGEENLEIEKNFLEENKNKDGVITTESGLQYVVLTKGDGPKPSATDNVTVHYKGTTIDGTEFDSSYKRGEPTSFPVNGVIKGWTEALQLMNVGSKYKLFIPSELAYGQRGAGGQIGPNAVLIFEVELLDIKK